MRFTIEGPPPRARLERAERKRRQAFLSGHRTILSSALAVAMSTAALAQYSASVEFPIGGTTGVQISPTVVIQATHPIDSSSVSWNGISDTIPLTVVVVRKSVAIAQPSISWDGVAAAGTYSMPIETKLRFTVLGDLEWNTEYVIVVKGLRILDTTARDVDVDTVCFRTTAGPHRLLAASHSGEASLCDPDTVRLEFNRKLDSVNTALGPLVELQRVLVTADDRWGDSTSGQALALALSADSLTVLAVPDTGLIRGEPYRLLVHVSRLTGDSLDDREIPLLFRDRYAVAIQLSDATGDSLLATDVSTFPATASRYARPGDTVSLQAPWVEGFLFSHWSAPHFPGVDSNSAHTVSFVQDCGDALITAAYIPIPFDSLDVRDSTGGTVQVVSTELDSLGGYGRYGARADQGLILIAQPDSGYSFVEWRSPDSTVDHLADFAIRLDPGQDAWIVPVFEEDDPPKEECALCGGIVANDDVDVENVVTLNTTCHATEEEEQRSITCSIVDPTGSGACYRITGRMDPGWTLHDWTDDPRQSDTYTGMTGNPVESVAWYVERLPYQLQVSTQLAGGGPVPYAARVERSPNRNWYGCGETVTLTAIDDPVLGYAFREWQPGGSTNRVLNVTIDEDESYTAVFDASFAIVNFHWIVGDDQTETPFHPAQTVTDVRILTMSPQNSTFLTVEFNQPVNPETITPSTFWVEEVGARIDGQSLQRYDISNTNFSSWYDGNTKLKIELTNTSSGLAIRKMQRLHVYATDQIESAESMALDNPLTHVAITENPDVRWDLRAWVTYDTDPGGSGEVYGMYNAARITPDRVSYTWSKRMPTDSATHEVDAEEPEVVETDIVTGHGIAVPAIGDDERLAMGVVILDEDDGAALRAALSILAAVSSWAGGIVGDSLKIFSLGSKLLEALAPLTGGWLEDEEITNAEFRFGQQDHWGMRAKAEDLDIWYKYGRIMLVVELE